MIRYIARRVVATIPTIIALMAIVFLMLHLVPGDPVRVMYAYRNLSEEQFAEIRHELGLDRPLPVQFASYIISALKGDLGTSIRAVQPVTELIRQRLGKTMLLAFSSVVVATVVGVSAGALAGVKKGGWFDTILMLVTTLGVSIPGFWFGIMVIYLFAVELGWFPTSGAGSWRHLVLPSVTAGLLTSALVARLTRSGVIEVLCQDHVRTARAKGLRERQVVVRHVLRNALIPVLTVVGMEFGWLLGGSVVVETVFGWPGVGLLVVQALQNRDYPVVQGIVLVISTMFVLVNLVIDLLYAFLDPRIRYE